MVTDSTYVDVSDFVEDFNERFFARGTSQLRFNVAARIAANVIHDVGDQRIGAPIARPHQILCVGLNYRDHAEEIGAELPDQPLVFTKSPNTLVGPYDDVRAPRGFRQLDWEVELGIVVGSRCSYLESPEAARKHVAGFVISNDVSERHFQNNFGGQTLKGKSAETFNPCGPWLVTPDALPDIHSLSMRLDVSGTPRQRGSTATMVLDPYEILFHLSQFLVLEPGDLVNTGTPPGVAAGMADPAWLQPGDTMTLAIEGLGEQHQQVIAPR